MVFGSSLHPEHALLPLDFQFTAAALQDFIDCPSRFYLRHIRRLYYPAPEVEPMVDFEAHAARRAQFHRLVQQASLDIPAKSLEAGIGDDTLWYWWQNFRAHAPNLPAQRRYEFTLSVPLAGRRLAAHYDLLALAPGNATIVNWVTAPQRPSRDTLAQRLQTIVAPYVLARAGAHLNGGQPITPESIQVVYWFADFPQEPEVFAYNAAEFDADDQRLQALAEDILRRDEESAFELTADLERCRFCAFRSLHDRGTEAGDFRDLDSDDAAELAVSLDFDQVAEIGF